MKIAVIGSGISGLSAAEYLSEEHDVTVFEKGNRIGGHADTQTIDVDGQEIKVDTGFIVFNPDNYPRFYSLLKKYNVDYHDSDMSFAVSNQFSGLEYNATSINGLFCQRKNLLSPKFYKMIVEITRFYREAGELLEDDSLADISLGSYLKQKNYSQLFINEHIVPMTSALWSGKADLIMDFPARYLVAFMDNHKMMQISNRPVWKTVTGGSASYLKAIASKARIKIRTSVMIKKIVRQEAQVEIEIGNKTEHFDKVIFACHSDQALNLIKQPTDNELEVLSAIKYQKNSVCLHSDIRMLPKRKKAWASWNVIRNEISKEQCTVSYYMNLLQGIKCDKPIIVSLNMNDQIEPSKVWKTIEYEHPIYNIDTINAQKKREQIQGKHNSYFCGAYWGWGFHEDGARSGLEAAQALLEDCERNVEK